MKTRSSCRVFQRLIHLILKWINFYFMAKKQSAGKARATRKTSKKEPNTFKSFTEQMTKSMEEIRKDPSVKVALSIAVVFFSVFMLIAQLSYLFSWSADFSLATAPDGAITTPEATHNIMGKFGYTLGHRTILLGFGVTGLFIPVWIFLIASKTALGLKGLNVRPLLLHGLFLTLLISTLFSWFTKDGANLFGGLAGAFLYRFWALKLGRFGVLLALIALSSIYVIIVFKITSLPLNKLLFVSKKTTKEPENQQPEEFIPEYDDVEQEEIISSEEKVPQTSIAVTVPEPEPSIEEEVEDEPNMEISVEVNEEQEKSVTEINKKVKNFGEYDPTLDLSKFQLPRIDLLPVVGNSQISINKQEIEANKDRIVDTLRNYGIEIQEIKATIGPTVTLYEIVPAAGVRISKIKNLEDDIALSLSALGIRIIAPIPGKGTIGIEVPNANPQVVSMRQVIASKKFQDAQMELPIALGRTITNENFVFDLAKMPHLLMAGATGQGKSVGLNAILTSLLYKKHPSQLKLVLVDPKKVELTLYNKIERHYLAVLPDTDEAIITDTTKVINTLNSLCIEMDNRYELLKSAMVRNIKEYNTKFIQRRLNPEEGHKFLPYIVLVIDEFADLIMTAGKEVEMPIARLAQLARAIGIHLIVATQRPSVNVITGIIKANFPARAAFRVTSKIDSRTILDAGGADQLIGKGDMLFSQGSELVRLQCAFVDTPEVENICEYVGSQQGYPTAYQLPEYIGEEGGGVGEIDPKDRDKMFEEAARLVVAHQQGSTSLIQRKLKLGYNRAGRIIDQLEAAGIVGPFEGSKARQVLIPDESSLEQKLNGDA